MILSKASTSSSPKNLDRALGLVISLAGGAGLYLLHSWLLSLRERKRNHTVALSAASCGPSSNSSSSFSSPDISNSTHERKTNSTDTHIDTGSDPSDPHKQVVKMLHAGSCHCGRVHFRLLAPEELFAVQYSAVCKMRFPRLAVPATDFQISSEDSSLSLYSVADGLQVGIHAFCSFCGMQVLYSPPPEQQEPGSQGEGEVVVNADCLDGSSQRRVKVAYGGARHTRPCALQTHFLPHQHYHNHHSHRTQPQQPQQSSQQQQQYFGVRVAYDQQQLLRPPTKAKVADSSRHSDSSGTRALTVSSEEAPDALELDDSSACSDHSGSGSVNLLHHLLDDDALQDAGQAYARHFPVQGPQRQDQQGLLARLRQGQSRQLQSQQASSSSSSVEHPAPHRSLSSSSLQQLGQSPSLYDTIPLMYSFAAAATSTPEQRVQLPFQQQYSQHQHQPQPQHSSQQHPVNAPVMIRGAELDQWSLGRSSHSGSATLHQRLKLYLQQHLDG